MSFDRHSFAHTAASGQHQENQSGSIYDAPFFLVIEQAVYGIYMNPSVIREQKLHSEFLKKKRNSDLSFLDQAEHNSNIINARVATVLKHSLSLE